jgi:hypothetical protein
MRVEVTVTAVSWMPSESLGGPMQLGIDLRMAHYDDYDAPPPDRIEGATSLRRLCDQDPFDSPTCSGMDRRPRWADQADLSYWRVWAADMIRVG